MSWIPPKSTSLKSPNDVILYDILYPYLSYGILLWGSSYKTYLTEIEVMQKKSH